MWRDGASVGDRVARAGAAAPPFVAAFGRAREVRVACAGTGAAVAAVASGAVLFLLMFERHVPKGL
jgi:hypothetical protein